MRKLPTLEQIGEVPKTFTGTIPVDYLDEMGHMNVMWYTYVYSQAIRHVLESVGLDREYIESQRKGTFAMEKHLRYLAEVRVGEQVSVYTRVVDRQGSRFHLIQFMVNDSRTRLASTMETVSTHVDLTERRSAPFPPEIAAEFDGLVARHQRLKWSSPLCDVMSLHRK